MRLAALAIVALAVSSALLTSAAALGPRDITGCALEATVYGQAGSDCGGTRPLQCDPALPAAPRSCFAN